MITEQLRNAEGPARVVGVGRLLAERLAGDPSLIHALAFAVFENIFMLAVAEVV
jgi:hypothetical protein